ncbi:MAG TPA: hypothetical protein VN034_08335, partial [Sphingopyxis sp.]|nr:hypothetical protein [Sphingopyxis sp.]
MKEVATIFAERHIMVGALKLRVLHAEGTQSQLRKAFPTRSCLLAARPGVSFFRLAPESGPSAIDDVDGSPTSRGMIRGMSWKESYDGEDCNSRVGYREVGVSGPRR